MQKHKEIRKRLVVTLVRIITTALVTALLIMGPSAGYLLAGQGTSRGGERGTQIADWDGVWETTYGTIILAQDGSEVRGTYRGTIGRIDGTAGWKILTFTWSEGPDRGSTYFQGSGEFKMDRSEDSFEGWFCYDVDTDRTDWSGHRIGPREVSGVRAGVDYCLWRGAWTLGNGAVALDQDLNSPIVSGEFIADGKYGTLNGEANGWELEFSWVTDEAEGGGTLEMRSDLSGFVGELVSGEEAYEEHWTGTFRSINRREDFSGEWDTEWGHMSIIQAPDLATANVQVSNVTLDIEPVEWELIGRVVGNHCVFVWEDADYARSRSGRGGFELREGGHHLNGWWVFRGEEDIEEEWSGYSRD